MVVDIANCFSKCKQDYDKIVNHTTTLYCRHNTTSHDGCVNLYVEYRVIVEYYRLFLGRLRNFKNRTKCCHVEQVDETIPDTIESYIDYCKEQMILYKQKIYEIKDQMANFPF